ncbi:MAG: CobW family GTP-binding protein [Methylococcales bacterium]
MLETKGSRKNPTQVAEIPCDIVTGFLGSGKTTLLRHVLDQGLDKRRIAILMNEVGDIGIDGTAISGLEGFESITELNSGCVCCSIDEFSFANAYQQIIQEIQPDLVIIETTGLADPAPILGRLESVGTSHDAVITVIDTENYLTCAKENPVLVAQVKAADFLVLNKTDLVSRNEYSEVERELRSINPRAAIIRTCRGQVPMELLFATGAARVRTGQASPGKSEIEPIEGHAHGVDSFSYRSQGALNLNDFRRLCESLPAQVYRAKGIVDQGAGEAPALFNFVCGRLDIEPLPALRGHGLGTQAVFIGTGISDLEAEIIRNLQNCAQTKSYRR